MSLEEKQLMFFFLFLTSIWTNLDFLMAGLPCVSVSTLFSCFFLVLQAKMSHRDRTRLSGPTVMFCTIIDDNLHKRKSQFIYIILPIYSFCSEIVTSGKRICISWGRWFSFLILFPATFLWTKKHCQVILSTVRHSWIPAERWLALHNILFVQRTYQIAR